MRAPEGKCYEWPVVTRFEIPCHYRMARLLLLSRESGVPVRLPAFPPVRRERLLRSKFIRGDVREDEAHKDRFVLKVFLIKKLSERTIGELPDRRNAQAAIFTVGPIQAPLVRFWVIEAQGQALDMAGRAVDFEFPVVGAAIPNLLDDGSPVVLNPRVRSA